MSPPERDDPIEPVTWGVVGDCALASVLPALVMLVLCILLATDGSNDRPRDLSDVVTGVGFGLPVAAATWAASTIALTALASLLFLVQWADRGRTRPT